MKVSNIVTYSVVLLAQLADSIPADVLDERKLGTGDALEARGGNNAANQNGNQVNNGAQTGNNGNNGVKANGAKAARKRAGGKNGKAAGKARNRNNASQSCRGGAAANRVTNNATGKRGRRRGKKTGKGRRTRARGKGRRRTRKNRKSRRNGKNRKNRKNRNRGRDLESDAGITIREDIGNSPSRRSLGDTPGDFLERRESSVGYDFDLVARFLEERGDDYVVVRRDTGEVLSARSDDEIAGSALEERDEGDDGPSAAGNAFEARDVDDSGDLEARDEDVAAFAAADAAEQKEDAALEAAQAAGGLRKRRVDDVMNLEAYKRENEGSDDDSLVSRVVTNVGQVGNEHGQVAARQEIAF